jgi:hypothetical protein
MEPIHELSMSITTLLHEIAEKRCELDIQGQKLLLDALRKLLIATEKLNVQLQAMAQNQRETETAPQPARAALYLVK